MKILSDTIFETEQGCLFTLHNLNGWMAQFSNYGARWISMWTPDKQGVFDDVLLGFNSLEAYCQAKEHYQGAIVGRVCGRINNARFLLDGQEYALAANDVYGNPHPNHLHGGNSAFHNQYWEGVQAVNEAGEEKVVFTLFSGDGDEGYPGNLEVKVTYTLGNDNVLSMECEAVCNQKTPLNITNHAFFNLSGKQTASDILSHRLRIVSDKIIECDMELIPTGKYIPVAGTELDFTSYRKVSDALQSDLFTIKKDEGFSLAYALNTDKGNELSLAAELLDEISGRKLSIFTNQPSLQVYTGYFMDGSDIGKGGQPYYKSAGIALETQGFPDAVNHPEFPSVILVPGDCYRHYTAYKFSIQ